MVGWRIGSLLSLSTATFEFVLFFVLTVSATGRREPLAFVGGDLHLPEHQEHIDVFHHCLLRWMDSGSAEEAAKGDKVSRKTIALVLYLPARPHRHRVRKTIRDVPD